MERVHDHEDEDDTKGKIDPGEEVDLEMEDLGVMEVEPGVKFDLGDEVEIRVEVDHGVKVDHGVEVDHG